jgi:hypothetical protein
MDIVDVNAIGINEKLARKYNAIANFLTKNTVYEDGMINDLIEKVEYHRQRDIHKLFSTKDYIKITTKTFNKVLWINNPKALKIDRKYNCLVKVEDLEI